MTRPVTAESEVIRTLSVENERLRIELDQWKAAAGWRADGFGPQTPDEVAVFQREAERVNGQVTGVEISKLQADVTYFKQQLERYWRRSDRNRRFAFLWKAHAKKLAARIRE